MKPSGSGLTLPRSASGVLATFIDQKPNKAVHCGIVGAADERRRLALLRDQARQNQPMQVVRKRRGGDPQFLLQMTNRQAVVARPNERSIDLEARRVAERFKLLRGFFDFHGNMCSPRQSRVSITISISVEIMDVGHPICVVNSAYAISPEELRAADVVDHSRLAGADEERTLARLRALRSDLIDPTIAVHHGRVVTRTGDGNPRRIPQRNASRSFVERSVEIRTVTIERILFGFAAGHEVDTRHCLLRRSFRCHTLRQEPRGKLAFIRSARAICIRPGEARAGAQRMAISK